MSDTVLMTATVQPNTNIFVSQSDPEMRMRQYQEAIAAMRTGISKSVDLVIVETSGADPSSLTALLSPAGRTATRVINFDATESDPERGKGRVEADALRHAIRIVRDQKGALATVHKVTGRLIVANAARIFAALPGPIVRVRSTLDRTFVDTRVISARAQEWESVVLRDSAFIDESSGVYLEHTVAASLAHAAALKQIRLERFPARPRIWGQSGSTGGTYSGGPNSAVSGAWGWIERQLAEVASRKQV
ncbi:hypothetical protein [Curtobacterium sp. P97]|uniref:hypothetical protein n=1 Tax=Curtobacterium sp. P97 TaxID=2939562 RepID=UPI002041976F|nr:hypothetical protein [Curtobacterium sp. P97]MCM3521966.1 hypothetical protein [Curtobacterium sp. P97]